MRLWFRGGMVPPEASHVWGEACSTLSCAARRANAGVCAAELPGSPVGGACLAGEGRSTVQRKRTRAAVYNTDHVRSTSPLHSFHSVLSLYIYTPTTTLTSLTLLSANPTLNAPPRMDTDPLSISFDAPPPPVLAPPPEDLTFPAVSPSTLFYLTISNPQADTWTFRGPFPSFAALLPSADEVLSPSFSSLPTPSKGKSKRTAKEKKSKPKWHTGFTRVVAPNALAPESFSVLDLVRESPPQETYDAVGEGQQAYTVLRAGPLAHDVDPVFGTVRSARGGGRVRLRLPFFFFISHLTRRLLYK